MSDQLAAASGTPTGNDPFLGEDLPALVEDPPEPNPYETVPELDDDDDYVGMGSGRGRDAFPQTFDEWDLENSAAVTTPPVWSLREHVPRHVPPPIRIASVATAPPPVRPAWTPLPLTAPVPGPPVYLLKSAI